MLAVLNSNLSFVPTNFHSLSIVVIESCKQTSVWHQICARNTEVIIFTSYITNEVRLAHSSYVNEMPNHSTDLPFRHLQFIGQKRLQNYKLIAFHTVRPTKRSLLKSKFNHLTSLQVTVCNSCDKSLVVDSSSSTSDP